MVQVNEIKSLVGENRIEEAIKLLLEQTKHNPRIYELVLLISGRYEAIEENSIGTGKKDDLALAAIRRDVLGIIRLLEDSSSSEPIKETIRIEVKIDINKDEFSKEKQDQLLKKIAELLDMGITDIRLGNPREGSIILPMELPANKAEKLLELIENGELDEFNVTKATNIFIRLDDLVYFFKPVSKFKDLSRAQLRGANLQGADLRRADLRGANLQEADLTKAYLRGAQFVDNFGIFLKGFELGAADLEGANLQQTDLQGANLRGAKLRGADLREADLQRVILLVADLQKANLYNANLQEAKLQGADLREADLREANLYNANLKGAKLWNANLEGANLQGADLREADLREARLREAKLQDCTLEGAKLEEAKLDRATAYRSQRIGLLAAGADISEVNFVPEDGDRQKEYVYS